MSKKKELVTPTETTVVKEFSRQIRYLFNEDRRVFLHHSFWYYHFTQYEHLYDGLLQSEGDDFKEVLRDLIREELSLVVKHYRYLSKMIVDEKVIKGVWRVLYSIYSQLEGSVFNGETSGIEEFKPFLKA